MISYHGIYCISPEIGINIDAQGFITTYCASTKYPIAHMDDDIDWINYISRPDEVDLELLENFHTYTKKLNSLKNSNIYKHLPRELQCIN